MQQLEAEQEALELHQNNKTHAPAAHTPARTRHLKTGGSMARLDCA